MQGKRPREDAAEHAPNAAPELAPAAPLVHVLTCVETAAALLLAFSSPAGTMRLLSCCKEVRLCSTPGHATYSRSSPLAFAAKQLATTPLPWRFSGGTHMPLVHVVRRHSDKDDGMPAVAWLLAHGAELNDPGASRDPDSALYRATCDGNHVMMRALLAEGASANIVELEEVWSLDSLWTPLFCACERKDVEAVRLLLQFGARISTSNASLLRNKSVCVYALGADVEMPETEDDMRAAAELRLVISVYMDEIYMTTSTGPAQPGVWPPISSRLSFPHDFASGDDGSLDTA